MGYLIDLNRNRLPGSIGNKAYHLRQLAETGVRVPRAYVISWEAYRRYLADDVGLVEELRRELSACLDPDRSYAVRSSASIEDGGQRSFAGQFKSVLNVSGVDNIFQAVWAVWGTTNSQAVQAYLDKHGVPTDTLLMAVLIQEMITPVYAGVALSRNPVTGADEIVVEAVEGSGDALVQSGNTPFRWINKWGAFTIQPDSEKIPPIVIDQVVAETRKVAAKLKSQVDLEWVYDGANLNWLQVRAITTLNRHSVYSNHISKEVLPGIIKPLIGSINLPLVCSMWVRLVTEMVGNTGIRPEDLARSFYYRVYFNMGALGMIFQKIGLPADSVELLTGHVPLGANRPSMKPTLRTFLRLPHLLAFAIEKWFFAPKMRKAVGQMRLQFDLFDYRSAGGLSPRELFEEIDRLYAIVQDAAYYNIVGPLLMMAYDRILNSLLKKLGVDFSRFDLMANVPALREHDPNFHLQRLYEIFDCLDPSLQEHIRCSSYADLSKLPGSDEFQQEVGEFLERFGQFSDHGNDFSATPWRETPDLVLDLIVDFKPAAAASNEKVRFTDLPVTGFRHLVFSLFYRRAQDFRLLREQISAAYTYGYGLFRYYYLALGEHLVRRDVLDIPQDIFYLTEAEIRQLVTEESTGLDARAIVSRHRQDIERFTDISLPPVIYGDEPPPIEDPRQESLAGVPTSLGYHTGRVTVVRGLRDFNKVRQGDVLVIPYSDVGWTPLFARAGAVISESGGMLSHSSIVAREYGIPAVVSVPGALNLKGNSLVSVDGFRGLVIVHENEPTPG